VIALLKNAQYTAKMPIQNRKKPPFRKAQDHAESMGESATAFINRAIDEAMAADQKPDPEN
jgi:hypothetical protein